MGAIKGESVEDDSQLKILKIAVRFLWFFLYTSTKNKPIQSLKNWFSERAFLSRVHSLFCY